MTYRHPSPYYLPQTKKDFINSLLLTWKGSKTELRQMSLKTLRLEFHKESAKVERELIKREDKIKIQRPRIWE